MLCLSVPLGMHECITSVNRCVKCYESMSQIVLPCLHVISAHIAVCEEHVPLEGPHSYCLRGFLWEWGGFLFVSISSELLQCALRERRIKPAW